MTDTSCGRRRAGEHHCPDVGAGQGERPRAIPGASDFRTSFGLVDLRFWLNSDFAAFLASVFAEAAAPYSRSHSRFAVIPTRASIAAAASRQTSSR
jgi:hypothetical protein